MSLPSQALRKLTKEIAKLQRSPPEGIGIEVGEQDILDINGWIQGPGMSQLEETLQHTPTYDLIDIGSWHALREWLLLDQIRLHIRFPE